MPKNVIILGAAGRDFHNFNVYYRDRPEYKVVAFTATQIPDIEGKIYPSELAGKNYPEGIPIYSEKDLPELIKKLNADEAVFAYSDISYEYIMRRAAIVQACGANFILLGPKSTMLHSEKPVIAVCAVRTGCGKSQTSRKIFSILRAHGYNVGVIRHPMPYGDLKTQNAQKFVTFADLDTNKCTIEEREEYEPYLEINGKVYAGIDYQEVLKIVENENEIIIWDGGNNDFPFIKPSLHITITDPHRAGHELRYHPGEINLRIADVVIINKMDTAKLEDVETIEKNIRNVNPKCTIIHANSPVTVTEPEKIIGKKVLVIEDGPTLTHGEMSYGAGYIAAQKYNADIVNVREHTVGLIKKVCEKYQHLDGKILPAMGYGTKQLKDLVETINNIECDVVVMATPIDLRRVIKIDKECVRVRYELEEIGKPTLEDVLMEFLAKIK